MLKRLWYKFLNFINSRTLVLFLVFAGVGVVLINRLFQLQIVNGEDYLENFKLSIRKERELPSTRGNIYDRNGKLLAYNELAYSVTIEDIYESGNSNKNNELNATLLQVIKILEENGDSIVSDFKIYLNSDGEYAYNVSGTQLNRFIADVYGVRRTNDLKEEQKTSTAQELIDVLARRYGIGQRTDPEDSDTFVPGMGYTKEEVLQLVTLRYAMGLNSYQKYLPTTIANDVSEESVAVIRENQENLPGIDIAENTVRKYENGPYFSHIIGYTGTISQEELDTLNNNPDSEDYASSSNPMEYSLSDTIGKLGIEKYMDRYLQGVKGNEVVYVDNVGREISTDSHTDPIAGDNVYLTIDADLQEVIYNILEQRIAGILLDKIRPVKEYVAGENASASNIITPIYDVYNALFANNVIDIPSLAEDDATETEKAVYQTFLSKQEEVLDRLRYEMTSSDTAYQDLTAEYQEYESYIINTLLPNQNILQIQDTSDETYLKWAREETISIQEFLRYTISAGWIDTSSLEIEGQYADSEEVYAKLVEFILAELDNTQFNKKMYKYMLLDDQITPRQVCQLLIDQEVINISDERIQALETGAISPYNFMLSLIENLEITPAQLALDPYSASCVLTDVNTGEVLALVSYPSYDNNRLANGIDAEYYARVSSGEDLSRPMWNYATQMRTAPGSTFKMVSATAAYMEGVANTSTIHNCNGYFDKFTDRVFRCWIAPSGHGNMNMQNAIRNSCNVYFYNVGYELGLQGDTYNSQYGIERLAKYADMYGLSEKSGIEIEESEPQVSDELSVPSAIGQGTHNYTTVGLARYVTSVANSGTVFQLSLLDKVTDYNDNLIADYTPEVRNQVELPDEVWDAIHTGMRGVVEDKAYFNDMEVNAAGKTGTAQEVTNRPNHALFVGYAPYENPEIAISIRIANGYSSDYAAQTAQEIIKYYYDRDKEEILTEKATKPGAISASSRAD